MNVDYYKVLRVEPDASEKEIKAAVDRMLKLWEPEKFRRIAQSHFDDVCKARDVLLDAEKRSNFDKERQRHVEDSSSVQVDCDKRNGSAAVNAGLDTGKGVRGSHKDIFGKTGPESEISKNSFDTNKPLLEGIKQNSSSEASNSEVSNNRVSERRTISLDGREDILVSGETGKTLKRSLSDSFIYGRNDKTQSESLASGRDSEGSTDAQEVEEASENVLSQNLSLKSFVNHSTKASKMKSDQLRELQNFYELRLSLVKFLSCMQKFGLLDKLTVTVNARGEVHLSDCVWCMDEAREGKCTCHCIRALEKPEWYVAKRYGYVDEDKEEELLRSIQENRKKRQNVPIVNLLNQ